MRINWKIILNVIVSSFTTIVIVGLVLECYLIGYQHGRSSTQSYYEGLITKLTASRVSSYIPSPLPEVEKESQPTKAPIAVKKVQWGGPDLWILLNKARVDNGVNPLKQLDEFCTIASIRLNELLALGKLDGHEGFASLPDKRSDLKWIFEKYVVAEFLVQGADSAQEAINLWFDTMGHKKLITGGEYVYGCVYAQSGFAVAITGY